MQSLTITTFNLEVFKINVWEGIGGIMLSTFLHSSWEIKYVNMIFQGDLAVDILY